MIMRAADGLGTKLRRLLELLDGDLETIYRTDGQGYRPRYTPVMKALADGAPRTIKQIAELSSISHSAASQTVSKMAAEGLIVCRVGEDAREKILSLSPRGRRIISTLRPRWSATQRAADGLERELDAPLGDMLDAAIQALVEKSFATRIAEAQRHIEKESA